MIVNNILSLSIIPTNIAYGKKYYDLLSSIEIMKNMDENIYVNGFEFQLLEEWDNKPPIDNIEERFDAWKDSNKYSIKEIAELIKRENVKILSVHAKRDIGIYLCSDNNEDVEKGEILIDETLYFTNLIDANICVFHLWDTWKNEFNIDRIRSIFEEKSLKYPNILASVENIPTHYNNSPFDLVKKFDWITLDLKWAALYNEFNKYEMLINKIINIHIQGEIQDGKWVINNSDFNIYKALKIIKNWGYKGLLTIEPNITVSIDADKFNEAIKTIIEE